MRDYFIKGATLTLFITSILVFVAYQAGYFGNEKRVILSNANGSTVNSSKVLQEEVPDSVTEHFRHIASSKVIIIKEDIDSLSKYFGVAIDSLKLNISVDSVENEDNDD